MWVPGNTCVEISHAFLLLLFFTKRLTCGFYLMPEVPSVNPFYLDFRQGFSGVPRVPEAEYYPYQDPRKRVAKTDT